MCRYNSAVVIEFLVRGKQYCWLHSSGKNIWLLFFKRYPEISSSSSILLYLYGNIVCLDNIHDTILAFLGFGMARR